MPARPNRYGFLDGLRGIAALYVLFYHIQMRFGGPALVANGYLAVDFFFMLSGFVIANAYEARLSADLSLKIFVARRFIRLLPLSVLGVAIGTAYLLLRFVVQRDVSDPLIELLGASALNLALVPKLWIAPATAAELFPANGPLWSLFFEMAVNILWAAALVAVSLRWLWPLAIAGAVLFAATAASFGTADIGWNLENLHGGIGRVTFGFILGVVIFRLKDRLVVRHPFAPWLAILLLSAVVLVPVEQPVWTVSAVLFLLPLALILGLGAGERRILRGEDALGRISYPLYALHVPLLMFASGVQKRLAPDADLTLAPLLALPIFAFATLALLRYDEPLRRRLDARLAERMRRRAKPAELGLPGPTVREPARS